MADALQQLEQWVEPLVAAMEPVAQRVLLREIAAGLRRSQAERIQQQRNPDGSPYEPRKLQPAKGPAASERARIKAMFSKLRTTRFLKASTTATEAAVGFVGRAARIAQIHQDGLLDKPSPGARAIQYPARELLGLTDEEAELVKDIVLKHLSA